MKKLLFLLLIPICISCGDDEDYFNADIVGVWRPTFEADTKFPIAKTTYIFTDQNSGILKVDVYKSETDKQGWYELRIRNFHFENENRLNYTVEAITINKDSTYTIHPQKYDASGYQMIDFISTDSLALKSQYGDLRSFKKE